LDILTTIQIYQGGFWGTEGERNPGTLTASQELDNNPKMSIRAYCYE